MNRFVLIVALLVPNAALASKYYHNQIVTHDEQGNPYQGFYYRYNAYTYKFEKHFVPENKIISNTYIYDYRTQTANQGASQQGLFPAYRYEDFDVGSKEYDSAKYTEAARSIDEKSLDNDRARSVQNAYTRDKLAQAHAVAVVQESTLRLLDSEAGKAFFQAFTQQIQGQAQSAPQPASGGSSLAASAEAKCMKCHAGEAAQGNGYKLPPFSSLDPTQKAKARERLITMDESRNMAVRAQLTNEEHNALVEALCK